MYIRVVNRRGLCFSRQKASLLIKFHSTVISRLLPPPRFSPHPSKARHSPMLPPDYTGSLWIEPNPLRCITLAGTSPFTCTIWAFALRRRPACVFTNAASHFHGVIRRPFDRALPSSVRPKSGVFARRCIHVPAVNALLQHCGSRLIIFASSAREFAFLIHPLASSARCLCSRCKRSQRVPAVIPVPVI